MAKGKTLGSALRGCRQMLKALEDERMSPQGRQYVRSLREYMRGLPGLIAAVGDEETVEPELSDEVGEYEIPQ